ncbi:uncharacterized protein [Antedon mediterranea]|uniref:uncharacterized protein n=1 Tax=Antedon mediterranea TaxID=105859 RepID=UPI003AF4F07E
MGFELVSMVIIISLLAARGNCLRCYVCTSLDKGCDDPFDSSVIDSAECTENDAACFKYTITGSGDTLVERGCDNYGNTSCEVSLDDEYDHCMYSCKTDKCNGAIFITSSLGLLVVSALTYFIIF